MRIEIFKDDGLYCVSENSRIVGAYYTMDEAKKAVHEMWDKINREKKGSKENE